MLLTQPNKFTVSTRNIKYNHLFLVDDTYGGISQDNDSGLGLYHLDTRFLSCYEIRINDTEPVCLLSSTEAGYLSTLVYTNGQLPSTNEYGTACTILEETLQLKRESLLDNALFEKYTLSSYNIEPVHVRITLKFDADFKDIFEIRHLVSPKHRELAPPLIENDCLTFTYENKNVLYQTRILFRDFTPRLVDANGVAYETLIYPLERKEFNLEIQTISLEEGQKHSVVKAFDSANRHVKERARHWKDDTTSFETDNDDFNEMLTRSTKDLQMLLTQNKENQCFIAAGIPWYVCLFGRDSIITARESLILNPDLAKWTLFILAQHQGKTVNPSRDEEPGKILHELRTGELAQLNLIPHTPYYGSVDATPLWLMLLHDYYVWTRDLQTVQDLWPNALCALDWINNNLSSSMTGYLTYCTHCPENIGIIHQGWKDSRNSAMYDNGIQAEPPIALVEVQGYVYQAKRCMMTLADILSEKALKQQLKSECAEFKLRFNQDFWMKDLEFYAMGLDSQGRQLRVISSNPGHCLESGLFNNPRSQKVANRLMAADMYSGWGIRTLSAKMIAYNPMSYHNGSIWPHDNAVVAHGMSQIGRTDLCEKVFSGLFEAARLMAYKRLPELFCGFSRDVAKADPPVRYPVACSPQAWAAASVFSLTQSMLSIHPVLQNEALHIKHPRLPQWINFLRIKNLRVGESCVDLEFDRAGHNVMVEVQRREGKLDVLVEI